MLKKVIWIFGPGSVWIQGALASSRGRLVGSGSRKYRNLRRSLEGSKITFTVVDGSKAGEKALKVDSHLLSGGLVRHLAQYQPGPFERQCLEVYGEGRRALPGQPFPHRRQ